MDAPRSVDTSAALSAPELRITIESAGDVVRVTLAGELDLVHGPRVKRCFAAILARVPPPPVIRIELASVDFMDSSGVAVLLVARAAAERAGSRITVSSASPFVERVLTVTGLGQLILEARRSAT